ncbi:MAG: xanthine dehydrogenase family protein subunit M [Candidatus Eremiobacteraeota bacterium]|nr:xanthine dehydrogenase family protein subunit M [Candidatus Eremiobacteraeota bacterium]
MLYPFEYHAPRQEKDLLQLLSESLGTAKLLAGGTDLLVDMRAGKIHPGKLIDIKKIKSYHEIDFDGGSGLSIGAAVRCIDVMESALIRDRFPLLAGAASELGSPQLRNRATIMGNLCTASPSADMAPLLLCMGARIRIASLEGTREVDLGTFFTGVKATVLGPGEVAEAILIPPSMAGARGGHEKLKRIRGHDLALASVALLRTDGRLRVAVGACAVTPLLLKEFAAGATPEEVCTAARQAIKPIDDLRASGEYRAFMVDTFIRRLMAGAN